MTKHEEALKKFKPGDRVRIMRKIPDNTDGWPLTWCPGMDKYVGKVCTIDSVDARGVRLLGAGGYVYPAHGLMPEHSLSGYFQKGDKVRVRETCADYAYGWQRVWNKHVGLETMAVGVVGTIAEVTTNGWGIKLDNGCFFPEWTLEHAPDMASAKLDVPDDIGDYTWNKDAFELVPAPDAPAAGKTDAVSTDGKAFLDWKIGDRGVCRDGKSKYEIVAFRTAPDQPIRAKVVEADGDSCERGFNKDGGWCRRGPEAGFDLMPPTNRRTDAPAVVAPPWPQFFKVNKQQKADAQPDHGDETLHECYRIILARLDTLCSISHSTISKSKETSDMSTIRIETITFVNGTPVKDLSQDSITTIIAQAERELAEFNKVTTKTRALKAKIAKLQKGINDLVEISDARYAAENPGEDAPAADA